MRVRSFQRNVLTSIKRNKNNVILWKFVCPGIKLKIQDESIDIELTLENKICLLMSWQSLNKNSYVFAGLFINNYHVKSRLKLEIGTTDCFE